MRNASRRAGAHRKATSVASARGRYEALEDQVQELVIKRQKSLDRKKQIEHRLIDIQAELNQHSSVSTITANLKAEKAILKQEERKGIDERKDWAASVNALKNDMKKLKENELRNSRVRESRPFSSSPAPPSSPGQFEEPDSSEPDTDTVNSSAQSEIPTTIPASGKENSTSGINLTPRRSTATPGNQTQLRRQPLESSSPLKNYSTNFSEPDQSEWDAPFDSDGLNNMPSEYLSSEDFLHGYDFSNPFDSEQLNTASLAIMDRFLELYPEDI